MRRPPIDERLQRPAVMGIVNVTPDSFSDGGVHLQPDAAVAAARAMLEEGAAIVDVGGESTRPGSEPVDVDEELRRVVPVLEGLAGRPVSIDTAKPEVARRAVELGVELVNDVTALRGDPALAGVVADAGAYLCLMHMQGEPRTMQAAPRYDDVVSEVTSFLEERLAFAVRAGIPGGAHLPRPRNRVRQDAGPESRARPPARHACGPRPAGPRGSLAEEHDREGSRLPGRDRGEHRGVGRGGRRRVRPGRLDLPRPRRAPPRRGAGPGRRRRARRGVGVSARPVSDTLPVKSAVCQDTHNRFEERTAIRARMRASIRGP